MSEMPNLSPLPRPCLFAELKRRKRPIPIATDAIRQRGCRQTPAGNPSCSLRPRC